MGVILRMNSDKFFNKFLMEIDNTDEYQFILISEDIRIKDIKNKPSNIMTFPPLLPVPAVINLFVNGETKSYKKAYLNQLQKPEIDAFVTVLVKAIVKENMKAVIICSNTEYEKKYLEYLCEYIEAEYLIKTYSFKKYIDNPKKAEKIKNKEEVLKILGRKLEKMERNGVSLSLKIDKDDLKKKLKKLGKKELRKIAKSKNIKTDKDDDKSSLIKAIAKKVTA